MMSAAGNTGFVTTEEADGVLLIRFNRPEKMNALNLAMYCALVEALQYAEQEPTIRVTLLTGTEGCFTSGNDLADFLNNPPQGEESPVMQFLVAISQARKPIIAAVDGMAVGVGVTMLLHCDLVLAGEGTIFQMPFVSLGLCPEAGSTLLLPRMMGHQRAAELLLLGEPFGAAAAREAGIVNRVVQTEELHRTAMAKARQLAAQPAAAVRCAKELLKREYAATLRETIEAEARIFVARLGSPEAAEALQAFMEHRKPDFSRFN